MRARPSLLSLLCVPVLACGGGSSSDKTDAATGHDGPGSGSNHPDAGSGSGSSCTANSSYSSQTWGSNNADAENFPPAGSGSNATGHQEAFFGTLGSAQPID